MLGRHDENDSSGVTETGRDITPEQTTWANAHRRIALGYVFFFAGIAAFTPFAAIYYRGLGFTGLQVGVLAAMPAVGLILFDAVTGAYADTHGAHRALLRASLGAGALLAFVASRFDSLPGLFTSITLLSFAVIPLRSLLDYFALLVGQHTNRHFGMIRVWGAAGYVSFVLTLGRLMSAKVTSIFLVAYAISLALTLLATWGLPATTPRPSHSLWASIGQVLKNAPFALLLVVAFAQAIAASLVVVSLGVHITKLGGTTGQVAAAFAIAAVSEIPFFLAGAKLMRRFGALRMLLGIVAIYTIRMFLLGFNPSPVGVIWLQILHGATFGAFLGVAVPTSRAIAGQRFPATAQAVLTMTSFGFGNLAGSLLGGALLDVMTTGQMYLASGVLMGVTLVIFGLGCTRPGIRAAFAAVGL